MPRLPEKDSASQRAQRIKRFSCSIKNKRKGENQVSMTVHENLIILLLPKNYEDIAHLV